VRWNLHVTFCILSNTITTVISHYITTDIISTTNTTNITNYSARKTADELTEFDWVGTFNWKVFVGITVVWILIFLSIFKGVKSTSWVVKFTVPLPLLILVILIIRGYY